MDSYDPILVPKSNYYLSVVSTFHVKIIFLLDRVLAKEETSSLSTLTSRNEFQLGSHKYLFLLYKEKTRYKA